MNSVPSQIFLRRPGTTRAGFSLVEVTLALGIAAFCLTALLGLLPVGLSSNQSAINQTGGATAVMRIVSELRAMPAGTATSPTLKLAVPAAGTAATNTPQTRYFTETGDVFGADGSSLTATSSGSIAAPFYRVDIGFTPPANDPNGQPKRQATTMRILVSWPAFSDRSNAGWAAVYQGSFETNVALDRN